MSTGLAHAGCRHRASPGAGAKRPPGDAGGGGQGPRSAHVVLECLMCPLRRHAFVPGEGPVGPRSIPRPAKGNEIDPDSGRWDGWGADSGVSSVLVSACGT
jgi:hypothetical protein